MYFFIYFLILELTWVFLIYFKSLKKPPGPLPMDPINMDEGSKLPSSLLELCSEVGLSPIGYCNVTCWHYFENVFTNLVFSQKCKYALSGLLLCPMTTITFKGKDYFGYVYCWYVACIFAGLYLFALLLDQLMTFLFIGLPRRKKSGSWSERVRLFFLDFDSFGFFRCNFSFSESTLCSRRSVHSLLSLCSYRSALKNMRITEDTVAKVVKGHIYSASFHPCTSSLLVAAGDKLGNVGLWKLVSYFSFHQS